MSGWQEDEWPEGEPVAPNAAGPPRYNSNYRGGLGRGYRTRNSEPNWRDRGSTSRGRGFRYNPNRHSQQQVHGNRKVISVPSNQVGRIIGRGGSNIRDIEYESDAKVKIGNSGELETDVTLSGTDEAIAKAEGMINNMLKEKPPRKENAPRREDSPARREDSPPKEDLEQNQPTESRDTSSSPVFFKTNDEGVEVLDWEKLHAYYDQKQQEKFAQLPAVVKDFYVEDPEVANMAPAEVAKWRKENYEIQVRRAFNDKPGLKPIPNPVMTFEQAFKHYPEILQEIHKQEFEQPSPIQCQAWPILLRGEDLIGIAQTGTGKTLAFLLPALIHIEGQLIPKSQRKGPTVLIMAPTRELALQIEKEASKYQYHDIKGICIYGGGDRKEQIQKVAKGADIIIATPGRFTDLVMTGHIDVMSFSYIVLDEADRMLEMGFEEQIRKALFDVRPGRQTVMTSATWPPGVRKLAESYLNDPIQVNVGSLDLAAVHSVTQKLIFMEAQEKEVYLLEYLKKRDLTDRVIIFCGKKATANRIFIELSQNGIDSRSLHGDRDQYDREAALQDMVAGKVNVLVATDVASRGLDIKDLTHVINLDFPRHIEEYVHRVGRTGRAGKTGISISYITRDDWAHARELAMILHEASQEVPDELEQMAQRFEAMKLKRNREGESSRSRGRRGGLGTRGQSRDSGLDWY